MTKHEKHLLIGITSLVLVAITWIMIGWFVTEQSPILLISNVFQPSLWMRLFIFFLIGLAGFYYEMTIISKGIQLFEEGNEPFPIRDEHVIELGIGLYIGFVLLGFVFGVDEIGILEGMRNVLIACIGFSISISLMLLGAVIARIKREHF